VTGPRYREWGFHCPQDGWIHWERFTKMHDPGAIGAGCDAAIHEAANRSVGAVLQFPGVDIDAVHYRKSRAAAPTPRA
jgi:hypothetical protein